MQETAYKPTYTGDKEFYPDQKPKIDILRLLLFYGKPVYYSAIAVGEDEVGVLCTVQPGKIFVLCAATLCSNNTDTVKRGGWMKIEDPGGAGNSANVLLHIRTHTPGESSVSLATCIPFIVRSGQRIVIFNEDPDIGHSGTASGYEIDENLFQTLL